MSQTQSGVSVPPGDDAVITGTWNLHGPWLIRRLFGASSTHIQFTYRERNGRTTHTVPLDDLQLSGDARILERETGRLVLDEAGDFTFTPFPAYTAELKIVLRGAPSRRDLFNGFMGKLPLAYIRAAGASLDGADLGDVFQLRHHGVSADYLRQVSAAGVRRAENIVEMRVHGVPADFPQALATAGYRYSTKEIVQLRVHGVNARYAADWKRAGLDLSADDLTQLRQHGVSVDYARATQVAGRPPLSADTLIELR